MPRKPRIEYAGALYHIMSRGDRRQDIYADDADRTLFLSTLGEACARTGWRIHAYVLMSNHYHLLLETPEANLVAGMRWLQGTYTQRFNLRHGVAGHLFQGRYKALVVDAEAPDVLASISGYIHLNPARARLFDLRTEDLADYLWSSYPAYLKPSRRPVWLHVEGTLSSYEVQDNAQGWKIYREHMRKRVLEIACSQRPWAVDERWDQIRRGWCLGGAEFRERLLERMTLKGSRESFSGEVVRQHDEQEAERLVREGLKFLRCSDEQLHALRKGAVEKSLLAWLVRRHTAVPNAWIARRLGMGRADCLSRYPRRIDETRDRQLIMKRNKLATITRLRD